MAHARRYRWLVIALVLLAGAAALRKRRAGQAALAVPAASWPPLVDTAAQPTPAAVPEQQAAARWVQPVDGACPEGYPVKANDNSGIYHLPGGRFYARTVPERCYAAAADAEADGYRRAKA